MRKAILLILAAAVTVFASCDKIKREKFSDKLIGKWIITESDGKPLPTNQKIVYTFLSDQKALVSTSISELMGQSEWIARAERDIRIGSNRVTFEVALTDHMTRTTEMVVTSITDTDLQARYSMNTSVNGAVIFHYEAVIRMERVTADYSEAILGAWDGRSTGDQGSVYDDGELHRWEYHADGTYTYYRQVDGEWEVYPDVYAEYFCDGPLLCTRWKDEGEGEIEHREWWEVAGIEDGVMRWTALRQRGDGSTYTATFSMKKVR